MNCTKLYEYGGSIRLLKEFIDKHNIAVATKNLNLNSEYAFHYDALRYRSMIDHFLFYKVMESRIE